MNRILTILSFALLTGCAHTARIYKAPDASALINAQHEQTTRVHAANEQLKTVRQHSAVERVLIDEIKPEAADLITAATTPEQKQAAQELADKVAELDAAHNLTEAGLAAMATNVEAANQSADAIEQKYGPEYLAKVDELVKRANIAEAGWAKDSAEIVQLKERSWLYRLLGILGAIILVVLAFLYFTGRLAGVAATEAAKIP